MKTLSIIIPVYFNEPNLPYTIPHLLSLTHSYPDTTLELIFVDDGSGDSSLDILIDFQLQNPDVIKVVKLTRNFGSMAALQAGLMVATGDCVGVIAADLQDPPELFSEMLSYWKKGHKAIFAIRQDREEPIIQKRLSNLYYALIRKFALEDYPNGGFDFFMIDRQIVNEINKIKEKNTNLMTLIYWLGFKPIMIPYVRRSRRLGKSRWTLQKKLKLFIDTFVAFSFFPIRLLSLIGFVVAVTSFVYAVFILYYWLFIGIDVKGYVPTMLIMTFTSGIQMTMLGVLGEYLWRTLDEVRRRPSYVVDRIYDESNKKQIDKLK